MSRGHAIATNDAPARMNRKARGRTVPLVAAGCRLAWPNSGAQSGAVRSSSQRSAAPSTSGERRSRTVA